MAAPLTTDQVWRAMERQLFAVLGFVTPKGEARTTGIVYIARNGALYIGTGSDSWKARHIAKNPNVSLTVTIPKRVPVMPWIKIPAATITFQGDAEICSPDEIDAEILQGLMRGVELDLELRSKYVIIKVRPRGEFITYGVGVPLLTMRDPQKARGRAPVNQGFSDTRPA